MITGIALALGAIGLGMTIVCVYAQFKTDTKNKSTRK